MPHVTKQLRDFLPQFSQLFSDNSRNYWHEKSRKWTNTQSPCNSRVKAVTFARKETRNNKFQTESYYYHVVVVSSAPIPDLLLFTKIKKPKKMLHRFWPKLNYIVFSFSLCFIFCHIFTVCFPFCYSACVNIQNFHSILLRVTM